MKCIDLDFTYLSLKVLIFKLGFKEEQGSESISAELQGHGLNRSAQGIYLVCCSSSASSPRLGKLQRERKKDCDEKLESFHCTRV